MAFESPGFANSGGTATYTAEQTRRAVFSAFARTAANTPGIISGGLLSPTDLQLTAPGSGASVNVGTGECIVGGSEGASQGGYGPCKNNATINLPIAANGSGNPRIDTVVVTISDTGYTEPTGGSGNQVAAQVITGTPTASASLANLLGAGAVPASSLLLGYVLAPNGFSNIITADIANVATNVQVPNGLLPPVSGHEWSYAQITAQVSVTDTSESTATALISPTAFTPDGTPVLVEFFAPYVDMPVGAVGNLLTVTLFEGATEIARLGTAATQSTAVNAGGAPFVGRYRFTPTAASHTYKVCAFVSNTSGPPTIGAGTGGSVAYPPAFVRFTKV